MYSNRLFSPLRYPGGKARFAPFVSEIFRANGLSGGHYVEPYAGGAGVALDLLMSGLAGHVHINDLDRAVFYFWSAVTNHADALLSLLDDARIDMDEWYRWRSVMLGECDGTDVERGFATLFMNRTTRSGILKGGVIGGKAQSGKYKLDARFKKDVLRARIERIAVEGQRISVYCEDAVHLLGRAKEFIPADSLIYLDPPYYVKGQGLYRNFYGPDDHALIARTIQDGSFTHRWVVSYDASDEISRLYLESRRHQYSLYYTAQKRYDGGEQMFFSSGLKLPSMSLLPRQRALA